VKSTFIVAHVTKLLIGCARMMIGRQCRNDQAPSASALET